MGEFTFISWGGAYNDGASEMSIIGGNVGLYRSSPSANIHIHGTMAHSPESLGAGISTGCPCCQWSYFFRSIRFARPQDHFFMS